MGDLKDKLERQIELAEHWGFGEVFVRIELQDAKRVLTAISGDNHDVHRDTRELEEEAS